MLYECVESSRRTAETIVPRTRSGSNEVQSVTESAVLSQYLTRTDHRERRKLTIVNKITIFIAFYCIKHSKYKHFKVQTWVGLERYGNTVHSS